MAWLAKVIPDLPGSGIVYTLTVRDAERLAEWLKSSNPDLKVLFTSGYTDDAIEQHGVLQPGVAFLAKPYNPAILARRVREILDTP